MSPPRLFDRALARQRLLRAMRAGYRPFLLERAAAELSERLAAVTREFPVAVDLGSPSAAVSSILRMEPRVGSVVRLGPTEGPGTDVVANEEALPLAPGSIDLAVSILALQGVNDLPGALAQIRAALRPDGLMLACLLGGESLRELRVAFAAAEAERGGASPRVAPFADVRAVGGLLQRAGYALPVVDLDRVVVRYGTAFGLMDDLRGLGLSNAMVERSRLPLRRSVLGRVAQIYAERFADPDGRVRATFDLVWLSGWAPHASQQVPLRPGSARQRLATALGTDEILLPADAREDLP